MWAISLRTVRDRWSLFVGAVLSIALGVALVQSSVVLLAAAGTARVAPDATAAQARALKAAVEGVDTLLGLSLFLGVFLSIFIIGSTLAYTVVERRRELALLRLTGASRRQVRRLLVGEGLLLALVGTALGAVLGLVATFVELRLVGRVGLEPGLLDVGFPPWTLAVDLATGLGATLAGVLLAARRAGRIRPLDALRDLGDQRRVMTVGRWVWGLLLGIPAVVGAFVARASGDVLVAMLVGLLVIFAGSISLQQLSPLVVPLVSRLFALPARRHVLGELAAAGMRDGVRRTATTAGPLVVLFGLVVGLFGILSTQTEATRVERIHQTSARLVVVSHDDALARILATPGVSTASGESTVHPQVRRLGRNGQWVRVSAPAVVAVDPAAYRDLTSVRLLDGHLRDFGPGTAVLGPSAGEDGLGTPGAVLVDGKRLPVVARMAGTIAGGADVLVDRRDVAPTMLSRAPTTTFVGVRPGVPTADVESRLADLGTVATVSRWARTQASQEGRENAGVMGALAGLGGLYAFLSMINAVAIGTAQRRREFAVARLAGASRRQVVVATVLEAMGVAAIGLALGAVVVALCLMGLRHGTDALLGVPVLVIPWGLALVLTTAGLVASAVTAAAASWSATRLAPVSWAAARE